MWQVNTGTKEKTHVQQAGATELKKTEEETNKLSAKRGRSRPMKIDDSAYRAVSQSKKANVDKGRKKQGKGKPGEPRGGVVIRKQNQPG